MHIHTLTLQCHDIPAQQDWYRQRGWHVDSAGTVHIGHSRLRFSAANQAYRYHYAIAAPINSIAAVERWCRTHVDIIESPHHDAVYAFDEWNADAIYFRDAVGNIGEFIARRDPASPTPQHFQLADCLGICEIGVAAEHVPTMVAHLQQHYGLRSYFSYNDTFHPIGGDDGLFIVVDTTREWFPDTGVIAAHTPIHVELEIAEQPVSLTFTEPHQLPY